MLLFTDPYPAESGLCRVASRKNVTRSAADLRGSLPLDKCYRVCLLNWKKRKPVVTHRTFSPSVSWSSSFSADRRLIQVSLVHHQRLSQNRAQRALQAVVQLERIQTCILVLEF